MKPLQASQAAAIKDQTQIDLLNALCVRHDVDPHQARQASQ